MSLAFVHLLNKALELRTNVKAVESSNGWVDMIDEEAVDLLDTVNDVRVNLVHVECVRDRGRLQAVLVGLIDVGRDVTLIDAVVRLDGLVSRVDVGCTLRLWYC